jgi:hypothetical protein
VSVSAGALLHLHPLERRIAFPLPPVADDPRAAALPRLPLARNAHAAGDLALAVRCVDTAADPLRICAFAFAFAVDVRPLAALEAPPDGPPDLAAAAGRLAALMLRTDVLRFLPCFADVNGDELRFVLGPDVPEPRLEAVVAQIRPDRIRALSGPPSDVPRLVSAADVVDRVLWEAVLPEMPVGPVAEARECAIDDLLASAVDDLRVDTDSEFSSEEPLPEDVALLLQMYGKGRRRDAADG